MWARRTSCTAGGYRTRRPWTLEERRVERMGIRGRTGRLTMGVTAFSINFDYRCPFARNANEHVLDALETGAGWEVAFTGFSLTAAHAEPDEPFAWDDKAKRPELLALLAGLAVRDHQPGHFRSVHRALFAARHDLGDDLRDEEVVRKAVASGGADADAAFAAIGTGRPLATLQREHEDAVTRLHAFGVPTFSHGTEAVFVRLMTRPKGDGALARATIEQVLDLLEHHPELNEYKHTTISR